MMLWLYPNNDTYTIFSEKPNLDNLIEVDEIPEGYGILRMSINGEFYYEPFPEVIPEPETPPIETIEDRLERLEKQLEEQKMNNLVLMDINLNIYEELLDVQDRLTNA